MLCKNLPVHLPVAQVIEKVLRKQKDHLCEKIARYTNMRKKAWHVNTGDVCSRKSDRDREYLDIVSITVLTLPQPTLMCNTY